MHFVTFRSERGVMRKLALKQTYSAASRVPSVAAGIVLRPAGNFVRHSSSL